MVTVKVWSGAKAALAEGVTLKDAIKILEIKCYAQRIEGEDFEAVDIYYQTYTPRQTLQREKKPT